MKLIIASVALAAATLAANTAEAKLSCYPLKQIEQALGNEYGEKQQFTGREETAESDGVEYRLYVNAETKSWSWVGIPAGSQVGCLIFAGKMQEPPAGSEPSSMPMRPAVEF